MPVIQISNASTEAHLAIAASLASTRGLAAALRVSRCGVFAGESPAVSASRVARAANQAGRRRAARTRAPAVCLAAAVKIARARRREQRRGLGATSFISTGAPCRCFAGQGYPPVWPARPTRANKSNAGFWRREILPKAWGKRESIA